MTSLMLGQAVARYLGALPASQRDLAAAEINRFVRKAGADRLVSQLTRLEVDVYQQSLVDAAGIDAPSRVEPLKLFLADLRARKLTDLNLGSTLRGRRTSRGAGRREEAVAVDLTQEGYDQLQHELQRLENEVVPSVREELAAAYQDRDFRENAPYDAAKARLGEVTGRIETLKAQLGKARIVKRQASTERAGLGSRVVLHDLDYDEELAYTLVGPGEVDTRQGRISIQSPVGGALRTRGVGDEVEVDIPTGKARYRIVRIERS